MGCSEIIMVAKVPCSKKVLGLIPALGVSGGLCMFLLCLCEFSPGTHLSSHSPKSASGLLISVSVRVCVCVLDYCTTIAPRDSCDL